MLNDSTVTSKNTTTAKEDTELLNHVPHLPDTDNVYCVYDVCTSLNA